MNDADQQIVNDFVIEASEHLADIENQLLSIEATADAPNVELVHEVFRNVHSVKGVAGFLGFATVGSLAHSLESVLNMIRGGELRPQGVVIETLLSGFDTLRQMVHHIDRVDDFDVTGHVGQLQELMDVAKGASKEATSAAASIEAIFQSSTQHAVSTTKPETPKSEPLAAAQQFLEQAQLTSTPAVALTKLREQSERDAAQPETAPAEKPAAAMASAESSATPKVVAATTADAAPSKGSAADANIRVPVAILDRLMNLAGELVLGRNQLLQILQNKSNAGLDTVGARLDQVTTELQEAIMNARMQQVGTVFNRFPRMVRDVGQKLGKQCRLNLEGSEVELDKTILENICDPLTHLIRNAIDHGIERPDVRAKAGKDVAGTLTIRAFHQAGKVHITVSDDGGGIHPQNLRDKAIRKGWFSAEHAAALSDREALRLIFRPGFSTAEVVTEVSGRGVGMDVVKTNIEKLGGTVEVDSTPGKGTTVHVKLPLTLAIIPSLIVGSCGERYAIPETSIIELVRFTPGDKSMRVERFQGAEALRLRGTLLPLVRLGSLLSDHAKKDKTPIDTSRAQNIIVVEGGVVRYGIVVDAVLDPEQIVVKPLGRQIKSCRCLAGATVLGDGQVAFILDIPGIAAHASMVAGESMEAAHRNGNTQDSAEETQTILLFQGVKGDLYAAPMAMVSRIEKISRSQIDRVETKLLLQYRGGTLPLMELEQNTSKNELPESVYVLVFQVKGHEMGLIVPLIVDICDASTAVDTRIYRDKGTMGVLVIEGRVVRLLDVHELAVGLAPAQAENPRLQQSPLASRRLTILLAEDSPFFREQVGKFLSEEGHTVIACEDGLEAWETLQQPAVAFDLVVTDVEMPRLNGFELCKRIRASDSFKHLPVVALTSLNEAKHIRMGAEAGVTDYQVKMDRDKLLGAINRFVQSRFR